MNSSEAVSNDNTAKVLAHPQYAQALAAVSEHRLAKARGDAFETQRHLRRARRAMDAVLRDIDIGQGLP